MMFRILEESLTFDLPKIIGHGALIVNCYVIVLLLSMHIGGEMSCKTKICAFVVIVAAALGPVLSYTVFNSI